MEFGTSIIKDGRVIHKSQNLRGMLDYARVSPVVRIESSRVGKASGVLHVVYKDGAESSANFVGYHIMIDFIRNRRSWGTALHIMHGEDVGYLTKPGIIARNSG